MIKIGELTQQLSVSPADVGVLVTRLDEELPAEQPSIDLPDELDAYARLPMPELYLG